jgi:hypothetical protein
MPEAPTRPNGLVPEAHFTLTELPGTLTIWALGIGLGLALAMGRIRAAVGPLTLIATLGCLGLLGDTHDWPQAIKLAIDAGFLLAAFAVAAVLWRNLAPRVGREPSR